MTFDRFRVGVTRMLFIAAIIIGSGTVVNLSAYLDDRFGTTLSDVLDSGQHVTLELWQFMVVLAASLILAQRKYGYLKLRNFNTLLHEAGHVHAATLVGFRPTKLVVNRDTSGHANYMMPSRSRLRQFVVAFAGNVAPAFYVTLSTFLLMSYGAAAMWMFSLAFQIVLLRYVRNLWGASIIFGWLTLSVVTFHSAVEPYSYTLALTVILLLSVVCVIDSFSKATYRRYEPDSDQATAGRLLFIPARVIAVLQAAANFVLIGWSVSSFWQHTSEHLLSLFG